MTHDRSGLNLTAGHGEVDAEALSTHVGSKGSEGCECFLACGMSVSCILD
jgi:hypothetical protein